MAGCELAPGDRVAALLGAAARDPAVFDDTDTLDIGRSPNPHLGFGGHPLLRRRPAGPRAAAFEALTTRLPGLRLAGDRPQRRAEFVIRGLRTLPVTA